MAAAMRLHGVKVPAERYAKVGRLSWIVYGYFNVETDNRAARRESVRIAMWLEESIAMLVTVAESRLAGK